MTRANLATTACCASVEGRSCRAEATKVLEYDSHGFRRIPFGIFADRQHYEQPLCDLHSKPSFHLRDVSAPNWRLRPVDSGRSASRSGDDR